MKVSMFRRCEVHTSTQGRLVTRAWPIIRGDESQRHTLNALHRSSTTAVARSLPRARCLMYVARRAATGMCRNLGGHWRRLCLRRALHLRQFHSDVDDRDDYLVTG